MEGVAATLGPVASAALGREQPLAALRVTERATDPVAALARLWLLGSTTTRAALDAALPGTRTDGAAALGLVVAAGGDPGDEVRALVDLRPYAADDATWWLASDLSELATGGPLGEDHVLGVGGASTTLAQWTPRVPVGRALDLGTGCGVQAFHLARHAERVTGTDLSERCLAFARFNAHLNAAVDGGPFAGRTLDLRRGDLLDPVAGETYDLVVSNPPFVITPRAAGLPTYEYRDAGRTGDDVVRRLVGGVGDVLALGGTAQLLGNWEHHTGEGWADRLAAWLEGTGLDAWVVQREVQDPAEYAETWARDGGHRPGDPAYDAMVAAWLDDFATRGVEAVGFGVVTLHRPATGRAPWRRLEELRGPIPAAPGAEVARHLRAQEWLAGADDEAVLAAHLLLADDVTQASHGRPGEPDPRVVLLQQGGGLGRSVQAGTALAALAGACDGDLAVGQVVAALGVLLERDLGDLRAELLPAVRGLVADGFLALDG